MTEQAQPIDITKESLKKQKGAVDKLLENYAYEGKPRSLEVLMKMLDEDDNVMGNVERDTYLAIREGMQVFRAVSEIVAEGDGLAQRLRDVRPSAILTDPLLAKLRESTYNFAAFAASHYIVKKVDMIIAEEGGIPKEHDTKPDLSKLILMSGQPEEQVMRALLVPIYNRLIEHSNGLSKPQKERVFASPLEFALFTKDVFEKYTELAVKDKDKYPDMMRHVEPYTFRVLDNFIELRGYENRSMPHLKATEQKVTFQPITPREIVGNLSAKRKIIRYVERMALYDLQEKMNPVLELGGLSWTNLFDGPPGTGKSSLFRLAMTRLSEVCQEIEIPYHIVTVDQSIKDEYYGKTGKILLGRLAITNEPQALDLVIFDDIDLLTSKRDDAQGADNDINNIVMQYLDGVFTVRRGNVINFAATNQPTGIDDALRNRFSDRLLIDGPSTAEDFADMLMLLGSKMIKAGFLKIKEGYTPFATQDIQDETGTWSASKVSEYMAEEFAARYKDASVIDFGRYMRELKQKNPLITGRSARAIVEAIKERTADFDVPKEWFSNRELFLIQPYDRKVKMLAEHYQRITPDVLFQEAQRYFDSEERFTATEREGHVTRGYNNMIWDAQAQLRFYETQLDQRNDSPALKVMLLRQFLNERGQKAQKTIEEAYQKAHAS